MLSPNAKGYFLEFNEHFVLAARTTSLKCPLVIEEIGEAPLDNKAGVSQMLNTVIPDTNTGTANVLCTLRPAKQFAHLATDDEARLYAAPAALQSFFNQSAYAGLGTSELVGVQVRNGLPLDGKAGNRWLLVGTPQENISSAQAALREWKLAAARMEPATLSLIGAAISERQASKTAAPSVVWEIGATASALYLFKDAGLAAAKRLDFGFDKIAEAVQAEMNLKFKGAAVRLFFNESYDFSDVGFKVATRIAEALQSPVAELISSDNSASFLCIGTTSRQAWFSDCMAKALGLASWQPNLASWCASAGLKFASNTLSANLSPMWIGLLGSISSYRSDNPSADNAWHLEWSSEARAATPPSAPIAVPQKSERPVVTPPAPVPAIAKAAPPAVAPKPAPAPASAAPKVAQAQTPAASPAPAKPGALPRSSLADEYRAQKKQSIFASPAGWAAIAAVLVLGLGIYFYQSNARAREEALRVQALAEQRIATEAEARRKAEQQAKTEAEARSKAEKEIAKTSAAAEAAKRQAQEESRRLEQETKRLLNARGSVSITTEPAGATISIANMAPRTSPATITDLRLGRYMAMITLDGYEPANLDFEIRENATSNPGVIRLVQQIGGMEIVTTPSGLKYEIRPAASHLLSLGARQGTTPASIKDLPVGSYTLTLFCEGWPNHEENVAITRGDTARVSWKAVGGAVEIVTIPSGATVTRDGAVLGVTPLTINSVLPGKVNYSIDLQGYTSTTLRGTVEAGSRLNLKAKLEAYAENLARISDLDSPPVPTTQVQPSISEQVQKNGGSVTISCIIDREGIPRDLRVEKQTDPDFGKRCLEAAAQWRFKPGMVKGKPVKTRVALPFSFTPSAPRVDDRADRLYQGERIRVGD